MELDGGSAMMCVADGSVFVSRVHLFRLLVCRLVLARCMSVVMGVSALGKTDV